MSFIHLALRSTASRHLASSSLSRLYQSRIPQRAAFSAASSLDRAQIEKRVLDVLRTFEKVGHEKSIKPSASFTDDLALDSLDAVEVVMAVEEEFSIEIPDAEADAIQTVQQAIDYIAKTPEGT
ncbi:acyl carrier protein-like protein [Multifurca ochricompacta]|uniref:Acyl carrier protein n=1 Tax=Multifurca ochricompacta TaxID=376703 RepID=A0AAD4MDV8_9AGAM|nr:acyl carrier protein-like protein [Multifurca ochricompacta]